MKRQLTNPNKDQTIVNTLQIYEGGTGGKTVPQAQENLDILPKSLLGVANGAAVLPLSGILTSGMIEGGVEPVANLQGPTSLVIGTSANYTITNYDMQQAYVVSSTGGNITRSKDQITYTANAVVENGTITVNGRVFTIAKFDQIPYTPTVTAPVNNATEVSSSLNFVASAFQTDRVGDTHANSDWQVATDPEFTNVIVSSVNDATNKTSWTATGLRPNSTLFMRVRYRSAAGKESLWSATKVFSTKAVFGPSSEVQKIVGSDTVGTDAFGNAVAVSTDGTTLVVGAWNNNANRGAVYVFVKSGSTWVQQQKLVSSDITVYDNFGSAVAVSNDGNTVIVGAYYKDSQTGAAYVFTRSGSTWTQQQKLSATDAQTGDYFGRSVALSSDGNTALVGSFGKSGSVGAAYAFTRSGSTWTQQQKLVYNGGSWFGFSVALSGSGDVALIGSPKTDYVTAFTRSAGVWTLSQAFQPASNQAANEFGRSIALSEDGLTAVIGAYKETVASTTSAGAAYVFTFNGTTWAQQQKLLASDVATSAAFGISVGISSDGNGVVVGANTAALTGNAVGAAYTYARSASTWISQKKLVASDAASGDDFGFSVALSDNGATAIIGAYSENSAAGSAYIFQ